MRSATAGIEQLGSDAETLAKGLRAAIIGVRCARSIRNPRRTVEFRQCPVGPRFGRQRHVSLQRPDDAVTIRRDRLRFLFLIELGHDGLSRQGAKPVDFIPARGTPCMSGTDISGCPGRNNSPRRTAPISHHPAESRSDPTVEVRAALPIRGSQHGRVDRRDRDHTAQLAGASHGDHVNRHPFAIPGSSQTPPARDSRHLDATERQLRELFTPNGVAHSCRDGVPHTARKVLRRHRATRPASRLRARVGMRSCQPARINALTSQHSPYAARQIGVDADQINRDQREPTFAVSEGHGMDLQQIVNSGDPALPVDVATHRLAETRGQSRPAVTDSHHRSTLGYSSTSWR
ncbi:hypothetical protein ACFQ9X_52320 [Catenulispora yoronensis]